MFFNSTSIGQINKMKSSGDGVDISKIPGLNVKNDKLTVDSGEDLKALHDYCKKRGIIIGPFKGMNAKQLLNILKENE